MSRGLLINTSTFLYMENNYFKHKIIHKWFNNIFIFFIPSSIILIIYSDYIEYSIIIWKYKHSQVVNKIA